MSQDWDNQCQRFEKDSVPPGTQDGCGAHWLPCGALTVPCVVRQCRTCMQNDSALILIAKITFSIHLEQATGINRVNSGFCDCELTLHSRKSLFVPILNIVTQDKFFFHIVQTVVCGILSASRLSRRIH